MDALPYVDTLLKEFLLFRGFTSSLQAFNADLAADKGCGFQASQISELVFHNLIPQHEYRELVSLLDFLNARIYCHLDSSFEPTIRKLEVSLLWLFVVHASRAGKTDKIKEFFSEYGESLLQGPDAPDWHVWFALPYLKAPARDPRFQCYFSRDWAALVETSLRNFLAEVVQHLPLPAVLRFNTDRLARLSLTRQVESLTAENAALQRQLVALSDLQDQQMQQQSQVQQELAAGAQAMPSSAAPLQPLNLIRHLDMNYMSDGMALQPSTARRTSPASQSIRHADTSSRELSQQLTPRSLPITVTQPGLSASARTAHSTAQDAAASGPLPRPGSHGSVLPLQQQQPPQQPGQALEHALLGTSLSDAGSESNLQLASSLTDDTQSTLSEATEGTLTPVQSGLGSQQEREPPGSAASRYATPLSLSAPATDLMGQYEADDVQLPLRGSTDAQRGGSLKASTTLPSAQQEQQHSVQPPTGSRPEAVRQLQQQPSPPDSMDSGARQGQRMREQQQQQSSALVSRQEWLEGHEAALTCCCFSPSGCNVASASSDGVVRIWAPEGLQGDTSRAAVLLCGGAVTALAWDRRADKVVLVGTRGKGIKAWHVDTKRMVSHIQLEPPFPDVLDVTCSPVEPIFAVSACEAPPTAPSLAAAARYGKLSLWNMRAFKRIQTFAVAGEPAMCSTSFSPDGRLIAASCADATLRIFDVSSRAQVMSLPVGSANVFARFLGDAQNLLTLASDGVLRHWALGAASIKAVQSWDVSESHRQRSSHVAAPLEPSLPQFAVAPHSRQDAVFTSRTGTLPVLRLAGPLGSAPPSSQSAPTGQPAARMVDQNLGPPVAGQGRGHSDSLAVADAAPHQLEWLRAHTAAVTTVDWHPTANAVVSGSVNHTLCITRLSL